MSSDDYIKWGNTRVDLGDCSIPEAVVGLLKKIVTEVLIGCQFIYVLRASTIRDYTVGHYRMLVPQLEARAFCTPSGADVDITINWHAEYQDQSNICGIDFSIHDRRLGMLENSKPAFSGTKAIELNMKYKER